ncbi:hypothetical protein Pla52o_26480 [Novipirellula galeiformis]|uniref:Carboxypeptidase regulatory-like domain-containing protein n=1 Tax=Novipirellula galeiformis TaxID=2528004 RepID=A0A5C6CDZ6_9BACT|nr:hypothetical protein [Novipirellula galeiformis]TWU23113.1 hypothetical protein Pla52o_26480 [Novipirellula galeiformis]
MVPVQGWTFRNRLIGGHLYMAVAVLLVGSISGCNPDTGGRVHLFGTVTLGGTMLDQGTIEFHPLSEGSITGGAIRDGRFEIPAATGALPGKYEVRIYSTAIDENVDATSVAPPAPGSELPPQPERINKRYNVESELTADVPEGGASDLSFELDA